MLDISGDDIFVEDPDLIQPNEAISSMDIEIPDPRQIVEEAIRLFAK
jgi:hypothetical protein